MFAIARTSQLFDYYYLKFVNIDRPLLYINMEPFPSFLLRLICKSTNGEKSYQLHILILFFFPWTQRLSSQNGGSASGLQIPSDGRGDSGRLREAEEHRE